MPNSAKQWQTVLNNAKQCHTVLNSLNSAHQCQTVLNSANHAQQCHTSIFCRTSRQRVGKMHVVGGDKLDSHQKYAHTKKKEVLCRF